MKKIILMLTVLCYLNADDCKIIYSNLYKQDKESLFLTASKLKEYCQNNDKKACTCYDNYMKLSDKKCNENDGVYCMVIATMLGYKDNNFLNYLKKSCDGNYFDGCYAYGTNLELNYNETKDIETKKEAIFYYKKACKNGIHRACKNLKYIR
ncbi:hypothetical protein CBLAS_1301 [Campylobacter blaseri]|uniref:Beta-lactamase n=1 Tax=Campylobacter blaseri TaxID=2042961 RepID=A0A2P8QZ43_9BACT|nr:hypothetical protein [Campylobacter blaseri]PSM51518.1 hypothetical protein CQ405_08110 [Campylobacter blaseri]PSM52967.1 hypothetical protein CRN67_08115 [Campylobacter blaseri]QKF86468.1 hypothetical protein CBLAS_1301 [Campylobacter blaseri]